MSIVFQQQNIDLLANQFSDSTFLASLLKQQGLAFDNVNDIAEYIIDQLDVYTAKGFMLDIIGKIVGQSRDIREGITLDFFGFIENGDKAFGVARMWDGVESLTLSTSLADAEFRTMILARIAYNSGDVTLTGVAKSISILYGTNNIIVESRANAELYIRIFKDLTQAETDLINATNLLLRASGMTINLITGA